MHNISLKDERIHTVSLTSHAVHSEKQFLCFTVLHLETWAHNAAQNSMWNIESSTVCTGLLQLKYPVSLKHWMQEENQQQHTQSIRIVTSSVNAHLPKESFLRQKIVQLPKEVVVHWCKVRRLSVVRQNLIFKMVKFLHCSVWDTGPNIIMKHQDTMYTELNQIFIFPRKI